MNHIVKIVIPVIVFLSAPNYLSDREYLLFDFSSEKSSGEWYIVNDDVMGGLSSSKFEIKGNGIATFSGEILPDNYGGFASVRSIIDFNKSNGFKGVIIRIRGDGNKYNVRFRTNRNFDGIAYQSKIQSKKNKWIELKIPFSDFYPTFRGMNLKNKPELESQNIEQIGLLIADKQFGNFILDIDWIKFY